jgi:ribosomal protein S12 methylthiotransferase
VDSEGLLGSLAEDGFDLCADPAAADVVVVNTCGFLKSAEKESLEHIREAVRLKKKGKVRAVVAAGCLPQRHGPGYIKKLPGVDAVMGIASRGRIAEVARSVLDRKNGGRRIEAFAERIPDYEEDRGRLRLTPRHTAYLRVSDGCDRTCTFCTIPAIRGKQRSKPMKVVLEEARELAADGAVELNLIAQDTTAYGRDLYGQYVLDDLLARLAEVDGVRWIRILYGYPTCVTDRLIAAMRDNPKVVPYLDLPVQHTREKMLRLMKRGISARKQKDLVRKLRAKVPGIVLRTAVVVGFPRETEEDFQGLLDDLGELKFDRLGSFVYSREKGTEADGMSGHVAPNTKAKRHERLMLHQQKIAFDAARLWAGRTVEAILDAPLEDGRWEGRTYGDAPEIDPVIRVSGKGKAGEIRKVRVTGAEGYDLTGEIE